MEAKSSVIKCDPSLPHPRSVPSHIVHHHKKKLQMSSANLYRANHQTTSNQNGNLDIRSNTSPAHRTNCQELMRDLVPANIRHKYGSHVVDQLISPEQVRSSLSKARTQCHQDYYIPRLRMETCFMEDYRHKIYYELGHCLRSNLFPGVPMKQNSLVHDSYTAEVNEKGRLEKHNNHHWHGRKTDELVQPPKKPRKERHQAKSEKPEVQPPPVSPPKEEDDFWDFYDKSI
ncbi:ciliary microtubule inner protein 4 isoform X2 [Phyllobates terribilis]|uniref:ciliary microtubule inner protein 4 isoform X2 n=1 Tax=Phyllobates terribilis TaxID=111132 RepID=UPI003CCAB97B